MVGSNRIKAVMLLLLVMFFAGCSKADTVKMTVSQVVVFDTPFTVYQDSETSPVVEDANVAVVLLVQYFTGFEMITIYGRGSPEAIESTKAIIGMKVSMKDLEKMVNR
jgi:hypothetical protein